MDLISVITTLVFLIIGTKGEKYLYVEDYFDQKIDHFNFLSLGNQTYKQRFLYNDTWWNRETGPIFFYTGNEANVEDYWNNSGFIFRAAKQFQALAVFAEHRYYGKSLPFGNASFTGQNIGFLSIGQALADYAFLINSFKTTFKAEKCPVIAFGGSLGGTLAAFMRFKYPNLVHGAISSSQGTFALEDGAGFFFPAVTKIFRDVSQKCEDKVRLAFSQLKKWADMGPSGLDEISRAFHLCSPLKSDKDYYQLLLWIRYSFVLASMMNYPYPTSFIGNFPAFPVKVMCERMQTAGRPADGLYSASAMYYNSSNSLECFDIYDEYIACSDPTGCGLGIDYLAFDYQACTEINLEASTTGVEDMFPAMPFNASMRDEYCYKKYKVLPRRGYLDLIFWGKDICSSSNIVFSNGDLDPWAVGGVLHNISDTLVAVLIKDAAHHLDLREDNPNDPQSVRDARDFELRNIQQWLEEFHRSSR